MTNSSTLLERKDVPRRATWNAESVYPAWSDWEAELEAALADLSRQASFEGRLHESPAVLADWLELFTGQRRRVYRLLIYANTAKDVDTQDTVAKGHFGRVMGLLWKFSAACAFAEPELLAQGQTLRAWAAQEARLAPYAHYFCGVLRQGKHRRSAEVETMLGLLQEPFGGARQTHQELTTTDLTFAAALDSQGQSHPVGQATLPPRGIQSADRQRRKTAWESFCDGHLGVKNTLASAYLTSVKQNVFTARVRRYDSVLHARLDPYNIPVEVFYNLIETFEANLPTWHRYWEVKRKALGVEQLHPYDIWAPLSEASPSLDYAEAVELIARSAAPLGAEYVDSLRRGCLEERWVDYAPNANKVQGAHASPCHGNPPFIVTSYDGTLQALSVLSHELGHAMHALLTSQHQPEIYNGFGNISMCVAETASNFHQVLTRACLREQQHDRAFRLALIDEAMFNFHRYFFIMPTLARFELEVHTRAEKGQSLTADTLNGVMAELYAEGYGETLVDDRQRTAITWGQFGHLYVPYYTFQYAIGISAAHALAQGVLRDEPGAVGRYLEFLKAGGSVDAMELFGLAGVDMAAPEPIEQTFATLSGFVDELQDLVA